MLESFRIVFTAYSLFLAVPTARFSLSFPLILHIMQKLRTNIRRIHATIMVGVGGFSGRNNVLSLVSWFRHSWSYVPPFFPCNFHHVFNAIYARTFLCKFQYAFHAMLWTFVAMWMPPICSASTFQRKMLRPTDFVQVFFRAVERSSNGIVPISEPTITPKGQVLDIK